MTCHWQLRRVAAHRLVASHREVGAELVLVSAHAGHWPAGQVCVMVICVVLAPAEAERALPAWRCQMLTARPADASGVELRGCLRVRRRLTRGIVLRARCAICGHREVRRGLARISADEVVQCVAISAACVVVRCVSQRKGGASSGRLAVRCRLVDIWPLDPAQSVCVPLRLVADASGDGVVKYKRRCAAGRLTVDVAIKVASSGSSERPRVLHSLVGAVVE